MIQKPKGTIDIIKEKGQEYKSIEKIWNFLMECYNYDFIRTPIFESSEVFKRSVGDTSDIVTKETYDFLDRGERMMTLRPEGTAGTVRSYIENKMYGEASQPTKLWYLAPQFRYERPQANRYREFYQFGVEVFGSNSPMLDAEVISIPVNLYKLCGLKGVKVNVNSLGDSESRLNYKNALIEYFKPNINDLCEDCQKRFLKNPLRILDCKVDNESSIIKNAPTTLDYLNEDSKQHFAKTLQYLNNLDIEYNVEPRLVRGLDYYTHTVFEVEAAIEGFGSQNVLCGGGRYNGLVEMLEGPETAAVGVGIGMERLLNALEMENIKLTEEGIDVYVIPMSENELEYAISLTSSIRLNGFKTDIDYMNRKIANNFKQADRLNAKYILIVGEEEVKNGLVTVKDNKTKEEYKLKETELMPFLDGKLYSEEHNCDESCGDECSCEEGCHEKI